MNKPISKHALRRALSKVSDDGLLECNQPIGTVVDRLWHEIEKKTLNGTKKRPARKPVRAGLVEVPEVPEPDLT